MIFDWFVSMPQLWPSSGGRVADPGGKRAILASCALLRGLTIIGLGGLIFSDLRAHGRFHHSADATGQYRFRGCRRSTGPLRSHSWSRHVRSSGILERRWRCGDYSGDTDYTDYAIRRP